ncbi:protein FAM43B [Anomaloglossus baeobatrachus]|uniref:protein FAM43B n=1 Tax=Anomaloglossus baeobatrachus TaxID=238106 RepID=UPI003F5005F7
MLPWRKSKFVLVKKDKKGKGVSYSSLLSSVLHSCPDLLPPLPLERLGNVFSSRRQKVVLNQEDPSYTVWYLGNAVTLHAKGEGCTVEAVHKIWQKSESGGCSTKMKLTLGSYGIRMSPSKRGSRKTVHAYLLHRITYCAADAGHPKVFSWVYRHQIKNKAVVLRCHAALVSKAEKAKAMEQNLCQTSMVAFNEFKRLKRQNDFRREQKELLGESAVPKIPLRKILNGTCSYNPPAERSRTVPRLSSILEEEEGGEEDWTDPQRVILRQHLSCDRDIILELAQDLRRLSLQRALAQKLLYTPGAHLSDWRHPIRTIC